MNILITGATGFISSHVLKIISQSKHNIATFMRGKDFDVDFPNIIEGDLNSLNDAGE